MPKEEVESLALLRAHPTCDGRRVVAGMKMGWLRMREGLILEL